MNNNGFIFVNLLPYREKQKSLQIKKFVGLILAFSVVGVGMVGAAQFSLSLKIENQESRNDFIEAENKKLDKVIKSISNLKEEIKLTLEKRKIVESLQTNRADGVNIVNELANNLPDDTNLKSIKKTGEKLLIIGQTSSNNKVSNYMTALEDSPVFTKATLLEIKQVVLVSSTPEKKSKSSVEQTVNEFSITVEMKKSEEERKRIEDEKKQEAKAKK